MISFESSDLNSFLSKANAHINSGEIDLAINTYLSCLDKHPGCIEAYNNISVLFNEVLQSKKAIFYIKKGIMMSPLSAELYRALGIFLFENGYENKSYKSFSKAISLNQKFDDVYFNLANLFSGYSRLGKVSYLKAVKLYRISLKLNPSNRNAYLNLGDLYSHFGDKDMALKNLLNLKEFSLLLLFRQKINF